MKGADRTNSEVVPGSSRGMEDGSRGASHGGLKCVDLDVDAPGKMSDGSGVGPADAGGRQERFVKREDVGRLQGVGVMVNLAPVESTVRQCIEEVALDEEMFERTGLRGLDRAERSGADEVGGGPGLRPAADARVEDRARIAGLRRGLALEEHPREVIRKVVQAPGQGDGHPVGRVEAEEPDAGVAPARWT